MRKRRFIGRGYPTTGPRTSSRIRGQPEGFTYQPSARSAGFSLSSAYLKNLGAARHCRNPGGSPMPRVHDLPREALVALNLIDHVGPVRLRQLLAHFGPDPAAVLKATRQELLTVAGIGTDTTETTYPGNRPWTCGASCDASPKPAYNRHPGGPGISALLEGRSTTRRWSWYVRGQLTPADRNGVALVGSRLTTPYGQDVARKLGYQLAFTGVTVVSGGAGDRHTPRIRGALTARGRTIAVLGTGINLVFPPENAGLYERISEHGAVITQFRSIVPPTSRASPSATASSPACRRHRRGGGQSGQRRP